MRTVRRLGLLVVAALALPAAAAPEAPRKLADLVGAAADKGERELRARGYASAFTETLQGRTWHYWWHRADDACALVAVAKSRFESIVSAPESDCVPAGGDPSRVSGKGKVTLAAARLLGVDRLMHRSHERDTERHDDAAAVAEFERGYRDAMQGQAVRAQRSAYLDGHRAGKLRADMQARAPAAPGAAAAALPGTGNSVVGVRLTALEGAMKARGFERWRTVGKGRVSTSYWRESGSMRRCLQVTARDGVVIEESDAGEFECK